VTACAVHPTNGRLAVAFQSGFVRIFEPNVKTKSMGANTLVETVEEKIEKASVRYQWTEIGKFKCEMVGWLAWDHFGSSSPLVACACADGSVKVFDTIGSYCTHNFRGHTAPVTLVKFDRDSGPRSSNYVLYSASTDCTVRVWSLTESNQIAVLKNHMSAVTDIDFYNPPSISSSSSSKSHDSSNDSLSNSRKLVTVGRDKIISIYHMTKGFPVYTTIPVYESLESCIVLTKDMPLPQSIQTPEGTFNILVAGEGGLLKIFNSKSAKCLFEQPKANAKAGIDYLLHVPITQKSKLLGRKKTKKNASADLPSSDADAASSSQMDQDATPSDSDSEYDMIVAVTNDQNMILHATSTLEAGDTIVGYNDEIIDASFVSANEVAVATNSTELRVFSLPSFSSKTLGLNDPTCAQHKEPIMALSVSPCKQLVVTASKDQTLIVWSLLTGRSLAQLTGHTQSISTVQFFNRTSRYIVSGGRDLTWKIWDIQPVIDKGHSRSGIDKVAGSILTVKSHQKDVNCVSVSPNDGLLATGSQDKEIKLFSIQGVGDRNLKEYGVLKGHRRGVWDVAFSPVDQVLASASADNTIKLWNLRDFTCIKTFEGHTASVLKVRFVSNGLQLLSSGADGLVKLWNVHDNECVNTFDKHEDKIWALAVDAEADGARFLTGGGDSMLCLWKDNTEAEIEAEAIHRDEQIQLEQSLKNFVREGQYRKALKLALKLEKPLQALQIIETVLSNPPQRADELLRDMVGSLDFALTQQLMTYLRDWNTNAKHSHAAQSTLFQLFHTYRADSMTKFPLMKDLLQALIPYSTRHFQRLDKLLQASYILDYTLEAMNLLPDLQPIEDSQENQISSVSAPQASSSSAMAVDQNEDEQNEPQEEQMEQHQNGKDDEMQESLISSSKSSKKRKRSASAISSDEQAEKQNETEEKQKEKAKTPSKSKSDKSAASSSSAAKDTPQKSKSKEIASPPTSSMKSSGKNKK
jgi:U3 small nucleolar RNA-associated protein 13